MLRTSPKRAHNLTPRLETLEEIVVLDGGISQANLAAVAQQAVVDAYRSDAAVAQGVQLLQQNNAFSYGTQRAYQDISARA